MKNVFSLLLLLISGIVFSQELELSGVVKDSQSGETAIGASISLGNGKGVVTDINGEFKIKLLPGTYKLTVSYIGYIPQSKEITINAGEQPAKLEFLLNVQTLDEVEIVANVARIRETPVAFSNISAEKIKEELSSRDVPMILNSTPGVYATEQGGGSGDARVTIRGFDQRNIAVMVDGVPVNDMENGWVYWSNWDGLGDITKTIQVQRGLGASKLAVPSVGGTINIITKGIESDMGGSVKQEVGNDGFLKSSFGYTTGQLKNGFGITAAGSYKRGNGWVDQTWTDAWSYFLKVQKRFDRHLISLGINGAPQKHGQRTDKLPIAVIDEKHAEALGINADSVLKNSIYTTRYKSDDRGTRYNPNWGEYTTVEGKRVRVNDKVNYYHKPLFNLSHFWNANDKLVISNVAYLSLGTGGGTRTNSTLSTDTTTGQLNFQKEYNANLVTIDTKYSSIETKSGRIIQASENNHMWYGLFSNVNYKISKSFDFIGGIDLRSYKGTHFAKVYDLLGGDYFADVVSKTNGDQSQPKPLYTGDPNALYQMKREGDKINYYYFGHVKSGGLFSQLEYKNDKWSSFVTVSVSETGYQRIDNYIKKDVVLEDTTFAHTIGWGDTLMYDGNNAFVYQSTSNVFTQGDTTYMVSGQDTSYVVNGKSYSINSAEAGTATTNQKWFLGYTIKTGVNYNINRHHHVFANVGYLSLPPKFDNVFDRENDEYIEVKNQTIQAVELGYGAKYKRVAANLNTYYTFWNNKPYTRSNYGPDQISFNINGIETVHRGIELDAIYKFSQKIEVEGLVSLGDWKYNSAEKVEVYDQDNALLYAVDFSAKGVHLGDAAQTQYAGSLRYSPVKGVYMKTRATCFANYYAEFSPLDLVRVYNINGIQTADNRDRESWKMPEYMLVDLFAGYDFKFHKLYFSLTGSVINLFDTVYISDALNGSNFNATSALVFFGPGRRYNLSLRIGF